MLQFSKYQGLGNDFVLIEGRKGDLDPSLTCPDPAWVRRICDRRFGVGADGLIFALPPEGEAELRMRIFNADGSEAEMCGNGIRCLARFLADSDGDAPGRSWTIETPAGLIVPVLQNDGQIRVDMGLPILDPGGVPTTLPTGPQGMPQGELTVDGELLAVAAVGMGNPHVVVPVMTSERFRLRPGDRRWNSIQVSRRRRTSISSRFTAQAPLKSVSGSAAPDRPWPAALEPAQPWWRPISWV